MRGKPGYFFEVDDGSYALAYHTEQNTAFMALNKVYCHFVDREFNPIIGDDGKPKTGLKSKDKLKLIGMID